MDHVELIPMSDHFLQVLEYQCEYRPQRLQLLVPQKMVVTRARLRRFGPVQLTLFRCFRWRHTGEIASFRSPRLAYRGQWTWHTCCSSFISGQAEQGGQYQVFSAMPRSQNSARSNGKADLKENRLAPIVLLLSDDGALANLVSGIVEQPWKLVLYGADDYARREIFSHP